MEIDRVGQSILIDGSCERDVLFYSEGVSGNEAIPQALFVGRKKKIVKQAKKGKCHRYWRNDLLLGSLKRTRYVAGSSGQYLITSRPYKRITLTVTD